MRKITVFAIVVGLLLLAACDDKKAREYAKELAVVLQTYQEQVEKKIKTEQQSYQDLADIYSHARRSEIISTLDTERLSRTDKLADSLLQGGKLSISDIHKLIVDYAKLDFESTRTLYEKETDDSATYLTGLENLELQSKNIEALVKALKSLSEEKSRLAQLKSLADFASQVKGKLDELECEDLARAINCFEVDKTKLVAEKTKLSAQKDALSARLAQATDEEVKARLAQNIAALQVKIAAVQAQIDKLQAKIDPLKEQMTSNHCGQSLLTSIQCEEKK